MLQRQKDLIFQARATAEQLSASYDTGLNSDDPAERQNAMLDLEVQDLRE